MPALKGAPRFGSICLLPFRGRKTLRLLNFFIVNQRQVYYFRFCSYGNYEDKLIPFSP